MKVHKHQKGQLKPMKLSTTVRIYPYKHILKPGHSKSFNFLIFHNMKPDLIVHVYSNQLLQSHCPIQ